MDFFQTTFLAVLQGISEWLPISSSGHLVLAQSWLGMDGSLAFDVFLHLASLLVILLFFRKQIKEIIAQGWRRQGDKKNWWWYIALSSVPTAFLGLYFYSQADAIRTPQSVSIYLLLTTALLLSTKFVKGDKDLNWKFALLLGIAQGLAVLPGLSRSGAVIATALLLEIKKDRAFEYGFIVAAPAILGSFLLTVGDLDWENIYLWGFLLTLLVSYASLALLRSLIKKDYFYLFFIYTLLLAIIINIV
ncbi:MAG: undecaprenyl-diphosphate phosphatase [Patescibacteria group bacterium]|nr:undecaprenyl-diphosphate phosphatase [Patescibacteria group bacterium]